MGQRTKSGPYDPNVLGGICGTIYYTTRMDSKVKIRIPHSSTEYFSCNTWQYAPSELYILGVDQKIISIRKKPMLSGFSDS